MWVVAGTGRPLTLRDTLFGSLAGVVCCAEYGGGVSIACCW